MAFVEAGQQIITGATLGLLVTAREIMTESLMECPIDTGTLRDSARIEPVEEYGEAVRVRFGYGYGDTPNPITGHLPSEYAVPVHEILEARHAAPTKAKFLEDPVLGIGPNLGVNMEATIRTITTKRTAAGTVLVSGVEERVFPIEGQTEGVSVDTLVTHG